MKVLQVGSFIRDQRRRAQLSLRKLAKLAGVSNPYLSQIERGLRRPSADILQAIARALQISSETLYVQAGILEERPATDTRLAIRSDRTITAKQKEALLSVYQSFQEETERRRVARAERAERKAASEAASGSRTRPPTEEARAG